MNQIVKFPVIICPKCHEANGDYYGWVHYCSKCGTSLVKATLQLRLENGILTQVSIDKK